MTIGLDGIATPPVYPVTPIASAVDATRVVPIVQPASGGAGDGGPDVVYEPARPGSREPLIYTDPRKGRGSEGAARAHGPSDLERATLTAALGHYQTMASLALRMSEGGAGPEGGGAAPGPGFTRHG